MKFRCPNCQESYDIDPEYVGKHFQCIKCQKYFIATNTVQQQVQTPVREKPYNNLNKDKQQHQPTSNVYNNRSIGTKCPVCMGEIPAGAFKCMHCGEVLRTKSGRPPVDRIGYIIWGLTCGILGAHYLYARRPIYFALHWLCLIFAPIIALLISKILDVMEFSEFFAILFLVFLMLDVIRNVAKDPNR